MPFCACKGSTTGCLFLTWSIASASRLRQLARHLMPVFSSLVTWDSIPHYILCIVSPWPCQSAFLSSFPRHRMSAFVASPRAPSVGYICPSFFFCSFRFTSRNNRTLAVKKMGKKIPHFCIPSISFQPPLIFLLIGYPCATLGLLLPVGRWLAV